MTETISFNEALEVVGRLDPDAQDELVAIVSSRLAEYRRAQLVERVAQARRELAAGLGVKLTPEQFLKEMDQ